MVSDSDLVTRLREILRTSDLDTATAGSVRRKLEEDFGLDLSDRKVFIREQIDLYLETLQNKHNDEDEEENIAEKVNQNKEGNENDAVEEEEEVKEEEEEVEEDESDEQGTKIKRSNKAEKEGKKRGGGFTKLCSLSPQLQKFLGVSELARTEVVKKLWAYIRENNLQDPKNKRNIKCDEALHDLFRVNSINMFQMNKALSKHIWPLTAEAGHEKLKEKGEDGSDSVSEGDDPGEEQEDEEDEEEYVEKEGTEQSKKGGSYKVDKDVKKRGGGFTKLCSLSPQLQEFTGVPELARTEVVKKLWAYIREKDLQDPKNKRNIICDESLRALFRVDSINMFQMNKALSKHIWPLNEEDAPDNSIQKERQCKHGREEGSKEPKQKEKRQKKGASGLLVPLPLSDALVKFFGTGENTLSRADVVKRMWEYIKQNDLQDPSDKRRIICDEKLKELFEVDSFNGFSVSKLLTAHFIKMEQ
ncbi:hypothetical protein P3X46_026439 [Hevea brasiliensis]|uniref:DM2 domain-containing protein n=1 Tax=Hevea brasiliensis TaxID=3981 RepID=A0ABQ9KZR3_HEVBR|nr:uncharacterized protein LOC110634878 isoform X2 [Hevea brasiliensis]KAJ9152935.1 hypothetical protein P3X46_026439 [Hevea brasiliensis]